MIHFPHLQEHVVRPVLERLGMWSAEAENLVLGTCAVESGGQYLVQLGGGPAVGLWQMEPATHDDIWENFLKYKPAIVRRLNDISTRHDALEMVGNLNYACAMCRLHYYRQPGRIPERLEDQAFLWKKVYNTPLGAGTPEKYLKAYKECVAKDS